MNISLLLGSRYSLLSMRAIDFLAPSCLASIAATMLSFSSWLTAMKRSHLRTDALRSTAKTVESPSTVMTSARLATSDSSLGSLSTIVMSWPLPLNIRARWLPISPAPAMTIFIMLSRDRYRSPQPGSGFAFPRLPAPPFPVRKRAPGPVSERRCRRAGTLRAGCGDRATCLQIMIQMYIFVADPPNFED